MEYAILKHSEHQLLASEFHIEPVPFFEIQVNLAKLISRFKVINWITATIPTFDQYPNIMQARSLIGLRLPPRNKKTNRLVQAIYTSDFISHFYNSYKKHV